MCDTLLTGCAIPVFFHLNVFILPAARFVLFASPSLVLFAGFIKLIKFPPANGNLLPRIFKELPSRSPFYSYATYGRALSNPS